MVYGLSSYGEPTPSRSALNPLINIFPIKAYSYTCRSALRQHNYFSLAFKHFMVNKQVDLLQIFLVAYIMSQGDKHQLTIQNKFH